MIYLYWERMPRCEIKGCKNPAEYEVDGMMLCSRHYREYNETLNYSYKNLTMKYVKGNSNRIRKVSFEFETDANHPYLLELKKLGFAPTYDSSIRGKEWKSPIMPANKAHYLLKSLENVMTKAKKKTPSKRFITRRTGTHIHIDILYYPMAIKAILHYYWSPIFMPLGKYLSEHSTETERIWGRRRSDYARFTERGHYSFVNTKPSVYSTIEWRLPKWKNAKQFARLIKITTKMTEFLEKELKDYVIQALKISPEAPEYDEFPEDEYNIVREEWEYNVGRTAVRIINDNPEYFKCVNGLGRRLLNLYLKLIKKNKNNKKGGKNV